MLNKEAMVLSGQKITRILQLGKISWQEALQVQRDFVQKKIKDRSLCDWLIFCQHHPLVYTCGKREVNVETLPSSVRDSIVFSERGGQITCHNEGQLVIYPIVDLGFRGKSVRKYVESLESMLIRALSHKGTGFQRKEKTAGIWTAEEEKIASIGLQVKHWISMHGAAINVCNDLVPFRQNELEICGQKGGKVTSLKEKFGFKGEPEALIETVCDEFEQVFHTKVQRI